ncbi:hypothetical protein TQ38_018590 [Novosphingobium sp. P6W]|nr:hypothetical protein TQ38_018590 [Novosphingobium sp. P6W]
MPGAARSVIGPTMDDNLNTIILRVLGRTPQWIRHDLDAKDDALRQRAEETLAAMIASAVREGTADSAAA